VKRSPVACDTALEPAEEAEPGDGAVSQAAETMRLRRTKRNARGRWCTRRGQGLGGKGAVLSRDQSKS